MCSSQVASAYAKGVSGQSSQALSTWMSGVKGISNPSAAMSLLPSSVSQSMRREWLLSLPDDEYERVTGRSVSEDAGMREEWSASLRKGQGKKFLKAIASGQVRVAQLSRPGSSRGLASAGRGSAGGAVRDLASVSGAMGSGAVGRKSLLGA